MELYNQFKAFVNAQPDDRPIIQDSWNTCAIGDFTEEIIGLNRTASVTVLINLENQQPHIHGCNIGKSISTCNTYKEAKNFLVEMEKTLYN